MISGIGIDHIENERVIDSINKSPGFREMVFSKTEIEYCERMANKAEHYAARFAAKEALLKALGIGLTQNFQLCDIEINNDEKGKPFFVFSGEFDRIIRSRNISKVHVSLSHLKSTSCAMVILEQ